MANFSHLTLQEALYQKLTGDSALMALVQGIYDRIPQESPYPYITLGEFSGNDWSSKTTNGTEQLVTFRIWSREGGRKETASIMEQIYQLLHLGSLTVSGQAVVSMQFAASGLSMEDDGWTYLGIMKFRILLQSN